LTEKPRRLRNDAPEGTSAQPPGFRDTSDEFAVDRRFSRDLVDENSRPPSADRASPAEVQTKVNLISHDECFHEEPEAVYQRCGGRYMTEIRNLGLTAQ
jgi:hypothetical protein